MQVQPVSSYLTANNPLTTPMYDNPAQTLTQGGRNNLKSGSSNTVHLSATLEAEYLKADSYAIDYTSKDGDRVTFSSQSVQYQKEVLQIEADGSPEDMKKIVDYIKKEYAKMKDDLGKLFLNNGDNNVDGTQDTTGTTADLKIPDYWNADNTSQRIVDFATSLFDAFKGKGEDFLKLIKDAIEQGFKEAKDAFGKLPDNISKLIGDTHDLVMQKLDTWAKDKGIPVNSTSDDNGAATTTDESVKMAA
jgi:hypothetical protein